MSIRLANLSTLYPLVSTDCPGLNENTAIDNLRWAARVFMQETHVSQDDVDCSIVGLDPILSVTSPAPTHYKVHRILSVAAPDRAIAVRTVQELDSKNMNWRIRTGPPQFFIPGRPGECQLVPSPTESEDGLLARCCFFPTLTTLKVDENVLDRYAEIIACGALSRILRIGGQPWTDKREAAELRRTFDIDTNRCRPHGTSNQAFTETRSTIRRQFA